MSRKDRRRNASSKFQNKQQNAITRFKENTLKMSRSIEQLQQQYAELCQKAGELQYKITQDELQLKSINQRIMILNKEYHEVVSATPPTAAPQEAVVEETKDVSTQG